MNILRRGPAGYFIGIFFSVMSVALILPLTSLFLSDELGVSGMRLGVFFAVQGVLSVVLSQTAARIADITGKRRAVIAICCCFGIIACAMYAFIRNYWILLFAANALYAVSNVTSQVFGAAREYTAEQGGIKLMTWLRMMLSFVWVIGPPITMIVAGSCGYGAVFALCSLCYLVNIWAVFLIYPLDARTRFETTPSQRDEIKAQKLFAEPSVAYLFAAVMFVFLSNTNYLIAMPIRITEIAGKDWVGILMGITAFLEVPIVYFSAKKVKVWHPRSQLATSAALGALYFAIFSAADSLAVIVAASVFMSVLMGITGALGMMYFQDLLPKIPGQATNLFSVAISVGVIVSGVSSGLLSEYFGIMAPLYESIALSLVACFLITKVRKTDQESK